MIAAPVYLVALASVALAAPVLAADTTSASEVGATSSAKPKEKVICKRETQVGSNLAARVCKTQTEWREEFERSRRTFEDREKD